LLTSGEDQALSAVSTIPPLLIALAAIWNFSKAQGCLDLTWGTKSR
jgi:hypothetical protein